MQKPDPESKVVSRNELKLNATGMAYTTRRCLSYRTPNTASFHLFKKQIVNDQLINYYVYDYDYDYDVQ